MFRARAHSLRRHARRLIIRGARTCATAVTGLTVLVAAAPGARSAERFAVDVFLGASWSFDSELRIDQANQPRLQWTATYESRSFEFPLYYAWRLGWHRERWGMELQLVHHKMHVVEPPPEVQRFDLSHGFNLLTWNAVTRAGPVRARLGLGVVVAHPETSVRGVEGPGSSGVFGSGYHVTGPAIVLGVGRAFTLRTRPRFVLLPELMLSAARARVPVATGEGSTFNVALHALLGAGVRF